MNTPGAVPSRAAAARAILSRRQIRAALRLNPVTARRSTLAAAVQASLSVTAALVLTHLSPWPDLSGFVALGALAILYGRFEPLRRRIGILLTVGGILAGAVAFTSLAGLFSQSIVVTLGAVGLVAGLSTVLCLALAVGAPGPVIIVFSAGAALGPAASIGVVGHRTAAMLAGTTLALLVCLATERVRPRITISPTVAAAIEAANAPAPVPDALRRLWIPAGRVVLAAGIAGLIAHALGWPHPGWAAIGATAALQGAHLHIHMNRALQRAGGTFVGALIAWSFLLVDLPFWWVVALVGALQFTTELLIGRNYGLGQMVVTPMALLLTELASPSPSGVLPVERVFETILGVGIGVVIAIALSSPESRRVLAGPGQPP